MRRLDTEEREHYAWLMNGLLAGARRIVGVPGREALLVRVLSQVEELFVEVDARIDALVGDGFPAWSEPTLALDDEAVTLEQEMIATLLAEAGEPELARDPVGQPELLEPQKQTADFLRAAISQRP